MLCKSFQSFVLSGSNKLKLIARFRHKIKQNIEMPEKETAVLKYLKLMPYYDEIKDKIPKALLRKYKTPECLYLIHKNQAYDIAEVLKEHLTSTSDPVIEVNPGFGFLSQALLESDVNYLHMFEISNSFSSQIQDLQQKYPDRTTYKVADFFGLWKLAFQDKMDNGNRVNDLLGDLATDDNDRIVKIVGAMAGLLFVKHIITTTIFHNANNKLGRPDLFITMSAHHYKFLTDSHIQSKSKSLPSLFQILFDYKVLMKIPKAYYLPWIQESESKKSNIIDDTSFLLVNIKLKEKLPCSSDHLPLLWYYFRRHVMSKSTRVIPMLEQWLPGCGVWLITGQDPPDTNKAIGPDASDAKLPHMTIFTDFGELNLNQKITVFKKFISWPGFEQCPFRVTMESNLPKFISPNIEYKETSRHIDVESENSDSENES